MSIQSKASTDPPDEQIWEFDAFLSYNRKDRAAVEHLAIALSERGLRVFKDDWYLRPGGYWPTALERKLVTSGAIIVVIGRYGLGSWQQREAVAALERQDQASKAGQRVPPVIPVLLEQGSDQQAGLLFLLQNTWIEAWDARAPDLIAGAVRGRTPAELYDETCVNPHHLICPYRGLAAFREEDAPFFFGREPDIDRLIAAVERYPLVAVVGPSGSGKSSIVRAGLIPRLRQQTEDEVWQVVTMTPGRDPFLALAYQLLPLRESERYLNWSKGDVDDECERLARRLEGAGTGHLSHVITQILEEEPGTTRLLLLVDQWEEFYTYRTSEASAFDTYAERACQFVDMLLETITGGTFRVVLTLRADYWDQMLNDASLTARLPDEAIIHLRTLDRATLASVIQKPAEMTELEVPDALVDVLLDAADGQPGDLPLLEFTLQQLWTERERSGSKGLSLSAYQAMGGLEKALVTRADKLLDRLDQVEREAVPSVFAAVVQVGELRSDLRRRAPLAELSAAGQAVARRFADERLLVTSHDWQTGDDVVEVAHEALLRHWPKLAAWIDARRDALLIVRQLQADSRNWHEKNRDPGYLWSHERVREAVGAIARLGQEVVLSDDEQVFLGPIDSETMLTELECCETDHERRALIGERLDMLGDPRPGVGARADGQPDINWERIESGDTTIEIRADPLDANSKVVETLTRNRQAFSISRYPITVAQYRAFLEAEDGWCEPTWWARDLYREPDGNTYDVGHFGNHPALFVSWFDALAFCRWLSRRLNRSVTLPDEWQWQLAASGGDTMRVYPWGSDWDTKREPHRANTFESRLGRVTAVGMYPDGITAAGVWDMGGSVWEWCLNKHDKPYPTKSRPDDFDYRILRGGSWGVDQDFARCTYRFRFNPSFRPYNVGFRVVCSSPSEGQ